MVTAPVNPFQHASAFMNASTFGLRHYYALSGFAQGFTGLGVVELVDGCRLFSFIRLMSLPVPLATRDLYCVSRLSSTFYLRTSVALLAHNALEWCFPSLYLQTVLGVTVETGFTFYRGR